MKINLHMGSTGLTVLVALAVGLSACTDETAQQAEPSDGGIPVVFVSNYPLKFFAETIAGSFVDVQFPVPTDKDPATWKPSRKEILAMQEADLILLNGASYESWLNIVSLPPSRIVDTTSHLTDFLITESDGITHIHGLDGAHDHSETAFTTWLDLQLAVGQIKAIAEAFSLRWPHQSVIFQTAATNLEAEILVLDEELVLLVNGNQDIPVLFSHPVYQYFERRYSINGESVHWEPDQMPDLSMSRDLEELILSHPAKWMIWESEPTPENASLLREMGISSVVIDPTAHSPSHGDFLASIKENIEALAYVYAGARK